MLTPRTPIEPLKNYLDTKESAKLLLGGIEDTSDHRKILSRIRELSVLIPELSQSQRIEIFEHFATLFQKIEKQQYDLFEGEGAYEKDLLSGFAWGFIKKTSKNGIVYFIAANRRANLMYMPDGDVYFSINDLSKTEFPPIDQEDSLPTTILSLIHI